MRPYHDEFRDKIDVIVSGRSERSRWLLWWAETFIKLQLKILSNKAVRSSDEQNGYAGRRANLASCIVPGWGLKKLIGHRSSCSCPCARPEVPNKNSLLGKDVVLMQQRTDLSRSLRAHRVHDACVLFRFASLQTSHLVAIYRQQATDNALFEPCS